MRDEVIDRLLDWKLPDGRPIAARARRREEVYEGPCSERAPDVIFELAADAGYGLSLVATPWSEPDVPSVRTLADDELAGGRGRGMNGVHRPDGVWIAAGAAAAWRDPGGPLSLRDAAPTVLAGMGVPWDGASDGSARTPRRLDYTRQEEERVAARLRALGYLE